MGKYLKIAHNTIDEYLTYRLNFVMWRVRVIVRILVVYFLWLAVFSSSRNSIIFGYSQSQMITYVLGVSLIASVVFSSRTQDTASDINEGNLSNYLIKPFSYFGYIATRDLTDKLFNIIFAMVEFVLLFIILKPPIFLQSNLILVFLTLISIVIALSLYYLISIAISFIAFWSTEVWAPRFLLFTVVEYFLGGVLFPLDILPESVFKILKLLPFNYLVYFPIKIYLGQLNFNEILTGLTISLLWLGVLFMFVRGIWLSGLKAYTALGR